MYENLKPSVYLNTLARPDDILFFDIETTGLSRKKDNIFLIGTGYYSDNGLNIIQWFAENESEEAAFDATEFEVVSGKDFVAGMLIREK